MTALFLLAALLPAQSLSKLEKNSRCERVELKADEMSCDGDRCLLTGESRLFCEGLRLWADEVEVTFTDDRKFAGAQARGNVMLVEGQRLITCNSIWLGPDRIQARIDDATVEVKRGTDRLPHSGVPVGKNEASFHGDIERLSKNELSIDDATFTLCDCGEGETPSWEVVASRIDATLGERATSYWTRFRINPFGLGQVTLPLPLVPVSIPLKSRAMGFLAPSFQFYRFPKPTIDLPFFIPLGDSWDLTVIPGLRMDWSPDVKLTPPSTWGAPRLGGRLRYAPVKDTAGEIGVSWTNDRKHGRAKTAEIYTAEKLCTTGDCAIPPPYAAKTPDWKLEDRVDVVFDHHTLFAPGLTLTARGEWVSDDLYPDDFGTAPTDRWLSYIPSRAQLLYRRPSLSASLGADYLLRLNNYTLDELGNVTSYSNLDSIETDAVQRGPAVTVALAPLELLPDVLLDGNASFVRYGPWAPSAFDDTLVANAAAGLGYARRVGPLELRARAGLDVLWGNTVLHPPFDLDRDVVSPDSFTNTIALTELSASTLLARSYGGIVHTIRPRLFYRSLLWRDGPKLGGGEVIDERLRRDDTFHQAVLAVTQGLSTNGGTVRAVDLTLAQPFDLAALKLYPTRLNLSVATRRYGSGTLSLAAYVQNAEERRSAPLGEHDTLDLREIVANVDSPWLGPLKLSAGYTRYAPRAGFVGRTIYELEAPPERQTAGRWLHYWSLGIDVREGSWSAGYSTAGYLPVPDAPDLEAGLVSHTLVAAYNSPCDCWGVSFRAVAYEPTEAKFGTAAYWRTLLDGPPPARFTFNISVAGYALGASNP